MARFVKILSITAPAFMIMCLAMPTRARATFEIQVQVDSGGVDVISTPDNTGGAGGLSFSGNFGTGANASGNLITINSGNADSNSPGVAGQNAVNEGGAIKISNIDSAQHTLTITVSAQGFTAPNSPPPLNVLDTFSGSVAKGTLVSATFIGYADATNALNGVGFGAKSLNLAVKSQGAATSFSQDGFAAGFSPNGAAYSLTFIETLVLDANSSITLTGGNVETAATPAPSTGVLALTALPLLGLCFWVRRRTTGKASVAA